MTKEMYGSIQKIISHSVRPIAFSKAYDDYVWGSGTSFFFNYNGKIYAITAKHVVTNQIHDVLDSKNIRIFMKNSLALPIKGMLGIDFDLDDDVKEEVEDFIILEIDEQLFMKGSGEDFHAWDIKKWSYPTSLLDIDLEIFVAGFPFTEDRYDYDNKKINELFFLRTGNLQNSTLGKGMYSMTGLPSDITFNGLSGAPVFCYLKGHIYFIGLITRGTATSGILHFISSDIIMNAMSLIENEMY